MSHLAVLVLLGEVTKTTLTNVEGNNDNFNIISHKSETSTTSVQQGQALELWCNVDSYWEFCLFTHLPSGKLCDFKWKKDPWNVTVSDCNSFEGRSEYLGDYNNYECGIRIYNMSCQDSGEWRCDLRMYDRAETHRNIGPKASKKFQIQITGYCISVGKVVVGVTTVPLSIAILARIYCLKRRKNLNSIMCFKFKKTSNDRSANNDINNTTTNQSQVISHKLSLINYCLKVALLFQTEYQAPSNQYSLTENDYYNNDPIGDNQPPPNSEQVIPKGHVSALLNMFNKLT